ncbi:MAG: nuclear transport factor 2 family protein [Acidobacteriia bacterium]|nr:nuclear transport factor 2 family protein [Terriglobia bacterium]
MLRRTQRALTRLMAWCVLLSVCALGQSGKDDPHAQETRLVVLEHLWNEAQVGRDANALANMIGDKFVNTEWDGEVSERGKFLADIADPAFKPTVLNIQDVKVNLFHDTAVVTGIYRTKGTYQGKPYDHVGRFTDTWVYDNDKWQCVASHTSLLKK